MKVHLSVSELARIVDIPPRTIRYYASVGLFPPSGTDPGNGYHYYTIEKIEELRLIKYLRHLGVPIREIESHLENRDISGYEAILRKQLDQTQQRIRELTYMTERLKKRMESLTYIRSLSDNEAIREEDLQARRILALRKPVREPLDWEIAMLDFEKRQQLPPSLFIGDIGFFVDLSTLDTRHPTEFTGLFMPADEPYLEDGALLEWLPAGRWLTLHFRGHHEDAPAQYRRLMDHIESRGLKPLGYALERVLLDHYIAGDPDLMITEIQIPIA